MCGMGDYWVSMPPDLDSLCGAIRHRNVDRDVGHLLSALLAN
jgi:hypothetical protein